ncbi:MAG: hypothetical protein AB7F86_06545 [Bdellovibrionales bacterium]
MKKSSMMWTILGTLLIMAWIAPAMGASDIVEDTSESEDSVTFGRSGASDDCSGCETHVKDMRLTDAPSAEGQALGVFIDDLLGGKPGDPPPDWRKIRGAGSASGGKGSK